MLVEQILSFFATNNAYVADSDEHSDIREYQSGDNIHDINWKKTATYDTLMSNTHEGKQVVGYLVLLMNQNMKKGFEKSIKKQFEDLATLVKIASEKSQLGTIQTKIIDTPPKPEDYQGIKYVIMSDFFRNNGSFRDFLQACQKNIARGIVPQLYTESGPFFHPLPIQYPHYFLR